MAKKTPVPSKEEKDALYVLLYESTLFQCHPITVNNVKAGVEHLLRTLKRDDLADLWSDPEKVAASHSS